MRTADTTTTPAAAMVSDAYRYVHAGPGAGRRARGTGGPVSLPAGFNDLPVDRAYRLQHEVVDGLTRCWGVRRAGFKISCTGEVDRARIDAPEPVYGSLTDAHLLESGSHIDLSGVNQPLVEPELLLRLIREPGPDATAEELADSVEVAAGLEVPICRFRAWWPDGSAPNLTLGGLIADNAVAGFVVVGHRWVRLTAAEIDTMEVEMRGPGGQASHGHAANVFGSPLASLSWLTRITARHGVELPAGSIVSSGTFTSPLRAAARTFTATYPLIGTATVIFDDDKICEDDKTCEERNDDGA